MDIPEVYTDDPDASWDFAITARLVDDVLDWDSPKVATDGGAYLLPAIWLGPVGQARDLRVPLNGVPAQSGPYVLYLQVPSGPDFRLGLVYVRDR